MERAQRHIRNGRGSVRPYVYGPPRLLDFVRGTFGAEVVESSPDGGEVALRLGDSMLHLCLGERFSRENSQYVTRGSIYVYVEDVDATYERALENGATSLMAPEDKPYEERGCGVRDLFGNTWWIATFTGSCPAR